ncbi:unnamed protein product [Peniophora sp. CBMAI 1063]|nr:unnamed protein product [Peniophora sp. CBMAI 1063]
MPHIDEYDAEGTPSSSLSHLRVNENLKNDVMGAVRVAVDALGLVADITQTVPYLGAISKALTEFLKIQNEVSTLKSDWKSVMKVARQIQSVIDNMLKRYEQEGIKRLPENLVEPLDNLKKCIEDSVKTLSACRVGSKRRRDRVHVLLNRDDLSGDIKQCSDDMKSALELFNTQVNWDTNALVRAGSHGERSLSTGDCHIPLSAKLRPPPTHFYGREMEVAEILPLIRKRHSHVAILGSGGIGKTSIALKVLHDPVVATIYSEWRVFVPCEAILSAEGIVFALLAAFNLVYDAKTSGKRLGAHRC